MLLLCDGSGSNRSRQYLFKQDLQALVNELEIEMRIAHPPPYTSKYNPIEHRSCYNPINCPIHSNSPPFPIFND